jgi:hypothetical protein
MLYISTLNITHQLSFDMEESRFHSCFVYSRVYNHTKWSNKILLTTFSREPQYNSDSQSMKQLNVQTQVPISCKEDGMKTFVDCVGL